MILYIICIIIILILLKWIQKENIFKLDTSVNNQEDFLMFTKSKPRRKNKQQTEDIFKLDNFVEAFVNNQEDFLNFTKSEPRRKNKTITFKNKQWTVQQYDSAILLDELITRINKLIDYIKQHPQDTYSYKKLKYWDSSFVLENIKESWKNNSTSYSINKGEELVFCIRDKLNNSIHDINTLMFVAIHELAHIVTDELQHTPKFWNNMKLLLKTAESINLYKIIDYSQNPVEYCGMTINSTPV